MVSPPRQLASPELDGSGRIAHFTKIRLRFRKSGDLRLVSHHDLLRCFERMLRRADLPFRTTAGYNPKPRLVFASALPLGVVGCAEVVELELDADLNADDVHARLTAQAPAGLEFLSARCIAMRQTGQVRQATYRLSVPPQRLEKTSERIAELLAAETLWVNREKPEPRRLDLRPFLKAFRLGRDHLEFDVTITPNGAARPDEVLDLLGLKDLPEAGAVIERSHLLLHDEDVATASEGAQVCS